MTYVSRHNQGTSYRSRYVTESDDSTYINSERQERRKNKGVDKEAATYSNLQH